MLKSKKLEWDKMKKPNILERLEKETVVILGLGDEGLSTYHFLRKKFPKKEIALADINLKIRLSSDFQRIIKKDNNLKLELGPKYLDKLANYKIIIKTAGIPITEKGIQAALKKGSYISSNTKIFFDLCPGKIIGITGTKGKSTTSTLTYQILKNAGLDTVLVGNIGEPPLNSLEKIKQKTLVVNELSSHQLAQLTKSPDIAIVQDIQPEHLDYYKDFASYFEAKTAIAKWQNKENILIYNPELEGSSQMATLSHAKKITHSFHNKKARVFQTKNSILYRPHKFLPAQKIIDKKDIPLLGEHNLYNIMPAIIVAKLFKVSNQSIRQSIMDFKPLRHRLELIAEINGVKYYDDSIATNPHAGIMALRAFPKGKVILLAGGHERDQDFSSYAKEIINHQVKHLILFPTTGKRIHQFVKKAAPKTKIKTDLVKSMSEAINIASKVAESGDVVLLSPAAASFGLFKNYKDRGDQFATAVKKIRIRKTNEK